MEDVVVDESMMLWDPADSFVGWGGEQEEEEPLFPDLHLDDELFSSSSSVDMPDVLLPLELRFEETQKSLEECMRKSQETRMSLTLATDQLKEHLKERNPSTVVDSVQKSAKQLQACIVVPEALVVETAKCPATVAQKA